MNGSPAKRKTGKIGTLITLNPAYKHCGRTKRSLTISYPALTKAEILQLTCVNNANPGKGKLPLNIKAAGKVNNRLSS